MEHPSRRLFNLCGAFLLVSVITTGCATFGRKRLDYSGLTTADRFEVKTAMDKAVMTITDRERIQFAIRFIQDRQDRWGDRISPYVPTFQLQFYNGSRYLGGFGVTHGVLVAFPSDQGWWWRDVPVAEIDTLLRSLGLSLDK
jgi:hypothetical protein